LHLTGAFFVTGIGTDVGKTVVSAILSEALEAYYWKPIQSGDLDNSDSNKIEKWTDKVKILQEKYRLNNPLSPHTSARMDGVNISTEIEAPNVTPLIVEGAGGILVPINDDGETVFDLMKQLNLPVIVVIKHYLGSINHTLLTLEYLQSNGITIAGLVVTGNRHEESERIIKTKTGLSVTIHVPFSENVNKDFITQQAKLNKININQWLLG
jgi:dethiobiotin synthetase